MIDSDSPSSYLFGTTKTAAVRLRLLADLFAPSTTSFLADVVAQEPTQIVDLGCGLGCTTALLADRFPSASVVGLDNSKAFLSMARASGSKHLSFLQHNVTAIPFPVGPSDLLYCRFLLTHIGDPKETIRKWSSQLSPNGRLIVEETESIQTTDPAFRKYLEIVESMLAHDSSNLYAGRFVEQMDSPRSLKKQQSRATKVRISIPANAKLYLLNLRTWRNRPFVRANYSTKTIVSLEAELQTLTALGDGHTGVDYGIRQVVFERKQ